MASNNQQPSSSPPGLEQSREDPQRNFQQLHDLVYSGFNYLGRVISELSIRPPLMTCGTQTVDQMHRLHERDYQISQLKHELASAEKTARCMHCRISELEHELQTLQDANQKLKSSENKLRQVILKSSNVDQILDSDMVRLFGSLYQALQAVAHNNMLDYGIPRGTSYTQTTRNTPEFCNEWLKGNKTYRRYMVQTNLYEILHEHVLDVNIFGVGQKRNVSLRERDDFDRLERRLQTLEEFFKAEEVCDDAITDWRLAALKCIQLLNREPPDDKILRRGINKILKPIFKASWSDEEFNALKQDVIRMCRAAYDLRLLTRQSRDDFWCEIYSRGTRIDPEVVDIHGIQNGSKPNDKVALTLFGALVKHAKHRGEEPVVLEKARVVVQGTQ